MNTYTPEMKQAIIDKLKEMNKQITQAQQQVESGSYEDAKNTVANIIDLKHEAVTSFPGGNFGPGASVPFFAIFDLFEELDRHASHVWEFWADSNTGRRPNKEDVDHYIGRLRVLIDELRRKLIERVKLQGPAKEALLKMIEQLEKLIKSAEEARDRDPSPESVPPFLGDREMLLRDIQGLKRTYLSSLPVAAIDLSSSYSILWDLDFELWECLRYLSYPHLYFDDPDPERGKYNLQTIKFRLGLLAKIKHELEKLVGESKPEEPQVLDPGH